MNVSEDNGTRGHEFIMNVPGFRDKGIAYQELTKRGYEVTIFGGLDCDMLEVFHLWNGPDSIPTRTKHWNIRVDVSGSLKDLDVRKEFVREVVSEWEDILAGEYTVTFRAMKINDIEKWLEIWKNYIGVDLDELVDYEEEQ